MSQNAVMQCPKSLMDEDVSRAQLYQLLGQLLTDPPTAELLDGLASLEGDDTNIGSATKTLASVSSKVTADDVTREYNALFIGLGRGEILPYASYYLTGFLNEKPLAILRQTLATLGAARAEGVSEPEDHAGFLCQVMAGLITGSFQSGPASIAQQKAFFEAHIAPWMKLVFSDIERAESAVLYAPIGTLGRHFIDVEADAFRME